MPPTNASDTPKIPCCLNTKLLTTGIVSYNESLSFHSYRACAHVLLWASNPGASKFGKFRANVMMHLRFDGTLGFPGGIIDPNEDELAGLNRELVEEIGWEPKECHVSWEDYFCTYMDHEKKYRLHFFITKITLRQYEDLEKECQSAHDFGSEVLGTIRVPLYTLGAYQGFPTFLNQQFIGIAKQQLLLGLLHCDVYTEQELKEVLRSSKKANLAA